MHSVSGDDFLGFAQDPGAPGGTLGCLFRVPKATVKPPMADFRASIWRARRTQGTFSALQSDALPLFADCRPSPALFRISGASSAPFVL